MFYPIFYQRDQHANVKLFLKIHKHEGIISSYVIRKNKSDSALDLFLFTLIFVLCCLCLFMLTLPIPVTPGWPHPFSGPQNGSASFVNWSKLCLVMLALYFLWKNVAYSLKYTGQPILMVLTFKSSFIWREKVAEQKITFALLEVYRNIMTWPWLDLPGQLPEQRIQHL